MAQHIKHTKTPPSLRYFMICNERLRQINEHFIILCISRTCRESASHLSTSRLTVSMQFLSNLSKYSRGNTHSMDNSDSSRFSICSLAIVKSVSDSKSDTELDNALDA